MQYRRIVSGNVPEVHISNIVLKSVTTNHLKGRSFMLRESVAVHTMESYNGAQRCSSTHS